MDRTGDNSAVKAVLAGDTDAFAAIVRAHGGLVSAVCRALLGDTPEADDAAQESFLKAYRALERWRGEASLATWLCAIAKRHCYDLLSKRNSQPLSLDELVQERGDTFGAPEEGTGLTHAGLDSLIDALPPDYRLALTLRETQDLSYREIAERMDCSVDSVKARLRRARRLLLERARHLLDPQPSNMQGKARSAL